MAYTVNHFYKKVLEATDKMGSDFFPLPYVMNRLEMATHDFIGETVKYIENTQEIRDDLRTLYKPYRLPVVVDPDDANYNIVALPSDYQHLMSAMVVDASVKVRKTSIIRHGQEEIFEIDPDTRATAEYPILSLYDSYLRIVSPGSPTFVEGFYLKKPTYGKYSLHDDIDVEIAVNLPEHSVDKIIIIIASAIFDATGDERSEKYYRNQREYRQRG